MTEPQRDRLAARQAELLRALLAGGEPPQGFDPAQLRVEANALLAKRRSVAAMLAPEVADALGQRFRPLFDEYAAAHPRAVDSGARADAAAFAEWTMARGELPAPADKSRRWWQLRRS
ncbi:hypothetical protein F0L68_33170 [Solihabitans fulvus]|uniref:SCO6045-like C-terminal domain-containing protein n=1 Tax=Solihabitans fulvus TaxID=1892852 RepID=A0A5B2WPI8_9PSEU|nr:hypothetical protein [Solihabitans fulvus]KAA2253365.1 hypothetical protein F0L68_33170 [Solihabitans fulvus]